MDIGAFPRSLTAIGLHWGLVLGKVVLIGGLIGRPARGEPQTKACIASSPAAPPDSARGWLRATAVVDVLCQPPGVIADVGLPSSAARSALRARLFGDGGAGHPLGGG